VLHGAPEPHWQPPVGEHVSDVVGSQAVQAFPAAPHAERESVVVHVPVAPPSQHPVGHAAALHTHSPAEHVWPVEHGPWLPHEHAPEAEHVSAAVLSHATHVPPGEPHADSDLGAHVDPMQQSPGHDTESQMHCPLEHLCPAAHSGPLPHEQSPLAEQVSARVLLHAVHAPPLLPHAASEGVLHSVPEQHPSGQCAMQLLQAPDVHVSPAGHALHAPPPLPHAPGAVPGSQVLPLQHPVGQDVESHGCV